MYFTPMYVGRFVLHCIVCTFHINVVSIRFVERYGTLCPAGGAAVPLEHEACGFGEARARGPHQPREHGQREDRPGKHAG